MLRENDFYCSDEEFRARTTKYVSQLSIINLTHARKMSIANGGGFIVRSETPLKPKSIFKADIDSIFSNRFGLLDGEISVNSHRCKCGALSGKIKENIECPSCKTKVKYLGEDMNYFAWIVLKQNRFIHPQFYVFIKSIIKEMILNDILCPLSDAIDADGKVDFEKSKANKEENPYIGLGMIKFEENFKEVLTYFFNKSSNKKTKRETYEFLIHNYNEGIVFTDSFPVYTTHLRPYKFSNVTQCEYSYVNAFFADLANTSIYINTDNFIHSNLYIKNSLLFKFQSIVNEIYNYLLSSVLPNKYGACRKIIGGRCNLTSRNVIKSNSKLGIDEVILSYYSAVKVLEQLIINILHNFNGYSMNDAKVKWELACSKIDPLIWNIIKDIIRNHKSGRGFPLLINRNPTIQFGGIMQSYLIDITDSYALEIPLLICNTMAADFDGDNYNIIWCLYDEIIESATELINPRNNLMISRDKIEFNRSMKLTTDIVVNLNSLHTMYFDCYDEEDYENIRRIKEKYS